MEAVAGTWGAEDREGTVLVVNTGLQEAILEQGDPVASLVSAPEGPAHPLHFHGSSSSGAPPQQVAHMVEDTEPFERMLEEEIPRMSTMISCARTWPSAIPRRAGMS